MTLDIQIRKIVRAPGRIFELDVISPAPAKA
jgi:hypothetical protein